MSNSVRKRKPIEHWKIIAFYLIIYDIVAINFSYFFGLLLRFDLAYSSIPENYLSAFLRFAPFYTAFSLIVFYVAHMYNSVWRFASFTELNRIFVATVVTTVFQVVGITTFYERMPGSYYIVGCISQFILTVAVRFMYRYITLERAKREKDAMATHRTMILSLIHILCIKCGSCKDNCNFSTVNCHCTHNSASFLCFHINRIKVTVIFTGTAFDTYVIVDVIRRFDLSADCTCRAVLRALTAANTEFRINVEFTKCCTDFCTAFLILNMFLVFITEAFQRDVYKRQVPW